MSGTPTQQELTTAHNWFTTSFQPTGRVGEASQVPLSFHYGDEESASILHTWGCERKELRHDADASHHSVALTDPHTGLELTCDVTVHKDFPVVEWIAHIKNTGAEDSPVISDIQALDIVFPATKEQQCILHHAKGSDCKIDDFAPQETALHVSSDSRLASRLGRSSNGTLPFFNLETGENGVIVAVGWTGGWAATFHRDDEGVRVRAGMEQTHLKLHPGEEIRTPRILLLFWEGDRLHGHNMLRQFILAHHTPRPNGAPLQTPICNAVWGENTAHQQIGKARWWKENDLPLDYFWIDAGWHGDGEFKEDSTVFNSDWWKHVGNWWPNKTTYPEGLKPVGDALKEMGFGFVLWLEPERVFKDTYFTREHSEWLLGPIGDNCLFNLGNPEARQAITDLISDLITEGGITCYRQDFNTDPAPFWEAADAPDRIGMSEIRHIEGLYRFWDDLLSRHPGLIIDNCSSGGRRIDLETISRSIPLWRSDFQCWPDFDPIAMQGQTHGLSMWVPLSTGCCDRPDTYAFRSALGPGIVMTTNIFERDPSPHFPVDWLRERLVEQVELRKYFYGDFYPLLSFSLADDTWAAWQFHRPDLNEGMVLALRRKKSPFPVMHAVLLGIDPDGQYEAHVVDEDSFFLLQGKQLMEEGLAIEINDKPGSAVCVYRLQLQESNPFDDDASEKVRCSPGKVPVLRRV